MILQDILNITIHDDDDDDDDDVIVLCFPQYDNAKVSSHRLCLGYNTGSVRLRRVGRFTHANQDHPTLPSIGSTGNQLRQTQSKCMKTQK